MIVDGLCAIASGENPRNMELHLQGYLAGSAAIQAEAAGRGALRVRRQT
jgi:flagellar motor component MotA